ncbi:uncharacterized protein ANIA_11492 [Aspergillus nidulans FGSC A4]|uniref:Uncharacterized protein n=1 Tax=Emericella nidulans (strain FGSC A4 / ATCC 38163 / CBS 112.46 / NRRL 194 / M139) TaxID=227321 RepID=C8UZW8_EMENI|nr:hypothetical protein [Aspergillus nidulans FGSC A4]CBF70639.1 TPA: hypothetical protein ANIA_11492 [Aspergillus nidulans FGSC A4]
MRYQMAGGNRSPKARQPAGIAPGGKSCQQLCSRRMTVSVHTEETCWLLHVR